MQRNNKKPMISSIISISIFLMLIFGATYAYVGGPKSLGVANYQLDLPTVTGLICTKTDCDFSVTQESMTSGNVNTSTPKASTTCSLNCTCSGTQGAKCNYSVSLLETGTPYTPSTGIGSGKEYTVTVSSPSGCTSQNSSNSETQVNSMRDKVVSTCELTVPSTGQISTVVSATFKWYNLNLDQTMHEGQTYQYELTSANRQVIYRTTTDEAYLGDNISVLTSGYETNRNNINQRYYLKHIIQDNIIVESYVCIKDTENGLVKEACLRGGDSSYYGTYDGISSTQVSKVNGATGNIKIIQYTQKFFSSGQPNCYYSDTYSGCVDTITGGIHFRGSSSGYAYAYVGYSDVGCYITSGRTVGKAYCVV